MFVDRDAARDADEVEEEQKTQALYL